MQGSQFEAEIREQPAVLRAVSVSQPAAQLAAAVGAQPAVFVGSGSSLFVAQLAALALRRRGQSAFALAASEGRFDCAAFVGTCVVALSQSGRTADVLEAVDALRPASLVALTNDTNSPLARRADVVVDCDAGHERAVPASKSVTAMAAIALWAAAPVPRNDGAIVRALQGAAATIERWLVALDSAALTAVAERIAPERAIVVLGAGFGVAVAAEIALKIKEAAYRHAEGFSAGEFRHGSTALIDASAAVVGIVDSWSRSIVERALAPAEAAGAEILTIGGELGGRTEFGPCIDGMFAPLGWIVAGQMLALGIARQFGVDSDAPRGLKKFLD